MPTRMFRDGLLTSEKVEVLDDHAGYFFMRLMLTVDDFGRYFANPKLLIAALYPLRCSTVTEAQIQDRLNQCAQAGLIQLYTVNNKAYLEVVNFKQRMRAKKSKFPAMSCHDRQVSAFSQTDSDQMRSNRPSGNSTLSDNKLADPPKTLLEAVKHNNDHLVLGTCRTNDEHMTAQDEDGVEVEDGVCVNNKTPMHMHITNRHLPLPGDICRLMKTEGIGDTNPSHPELILLIQSGIHPEAFSHAARLAHAKNKGFAYALGIVSSQHADKLRHRLPFSSNHQDQRYDHTHHAVVEPA